uniref:Uncharacterized protein n=1 Tax=Paramormyrops kingsleyae TaxID=1676925 RepID=A0A3B3QHI9_9TELE
MSVSLFSQQRASFCTRKTGMAGFIPGHEDEPANEASLSRWRVGKRGGADGGWVSPGCSDTHISHAGLLSAHVASLGHILVHLAWGRQFGSFACCVHETSRAGPREQRLS